MSKIQRLKLFKTSFEGEEISLHKLGYDETQTDHQKLAYIRGYISRKYKVKVVFPLDNIILFMVFDAISKVLKDV